MKSNATFTFVSGPPATGSSRGSSSGRPGSPASQNGAGTPGPQDSIASPASYQVKENSYLSHRNIDSFPRI